MAFTTSTKALELTASYQTAHTVSPSALSASLPSLTVTNGGPIVPSNISAIGSEVIPYCGSALPDYSGSTNGYYHPISTRMPDGTRIVIFGYGGGCVHSTLIQAVWDDETNNMQRCTQPMPLYTETSESNRPTNFQVQAINATRFAVFNRGTSVSVWSYDPTTKIIRQMTETEVAPLYASTYKVDMCPVDDTSFLVASSNTTNYAIERFTFNDTTGALTKTTVISTASSNPEIRIAKANPSAQEYIYAFRQPSGTAWNVIRADFDTGTDTMSTVTTDVIDPGTALADVDVAVEYMSETGTDYGAVFCYRTATNAFQIQYFSSDTASALVSTSTTTYSSINRVRWHDCGWKDGVGYISAHSTGGSSTSSFTIFSLESDALASYDLSAPGSAYRCQIFGHDGKIHISYFSGNKSFTLENTSATSEENTLVSWGPANGKRFEWKEDLGRYVAMMNRYCWVLDSNFNIVASGSVATSSGMIDAFDIVTDDFTSALVVSFSLQPGLDQNGSGSRTVEKVTLPTALNSSLAQDWTHNVSGSSSMSWTADTRGADILSYGGDKWLICAGGFRSSANYYGFLAGISTAEYEYYETNTWASSAQKGGYDTFTLIKYDASATRNAMGSLCSNSGNNFINSWHVEEPPFSSSTTLASTNNSSVNLSSLTCVYGGVYASRIDTARHAVFGAWKGSANNGSILVSESANGNDYKSDGIFWYGDTSYIKTSAITLDVNNTSLALNAGSGSSQSQAAKTGIYGDFLGGVYFDEDSTQRAAFYKNKTVNFTIQLQLNGGTETSTYIIDYPVNHGATVELTNPIILEGDDVVQIKANFGNYLQASIAAMELS